MLLNSKLDFLGEFTGKFAFVKDKINHKVFIAYFIHTLKDLLLYNMLI